jgi:hypothetical protein
VLAGPPDDGDAIVMALSEGDQTAMRERRRSAPTPEVRRGYDIAKKRFGW